MKRLSFNPRFINEAGNNLREGKIHTIRRNYAYWKRFEGHDIALFTWEGKPYRSKQKVFCVKRLVSIQRIEKAKGIFLVPKELCDLVYINMDKLAKNDGFPSRESFEDWFVKYPDGEMAILHFTDYRY
jgi:hypothetical protein